MCVSPQFPDNLPCSVALQPAPHDVGKVKTRGRSAVKANTDGDSSSLCSNVPLSLRSKPSARRAKTLKSASGEPDEQPSKTCVTNITHCPTSPLFVIGPPNLSRRVHTLSLMLASVCRSSLKLMIRKVQFAPDTDAAAPSVETTRDFVMSEKPLHVKTSLDKEVRGHTGSLSCGFKHLPQM